MAQEEEHITEPTEEGEVNGGVLFLLVPFDKMSVPFDMGSF